LNLLRESSTADHEPSSTKVNDVLGRLSTLFDGSVTHDSFSDILDASDDAGGLATFVLSVQNWSTVKLSRIEDLDTKLSERDGELAAADLRVGKLELEIRHYIGEKEELKAVGVTRDRKLEKVESEKEIGERDLHEKEEKIKLLREETEQEVEVLKKENERERERCASLSMVLQKSNQEIFRLHRESQVLLPELQNTIEVGFTRLDTVWREMHRLVGYLHGLVGEGVPVELALTSSLCFDDLKSLEGFKRIVEESAGVEGVYGIVDDAVKVVETLLHTRISVSRFVLSVSYL
jgi:hypothetical protein